MKKAEFNDLLNYLKNRPEEVARLKAVLGAETPKATPVWVTAKAAGDTIGKSGSWVRKHIDLFPSARTVQRGGRDVWLINRDEVKTQYNIYLFNH